MIQVTELEEQIKNEFSGADDLVMKRVLAGERKVTLVYVDGMVNVQEVDLAILKPITESNGAFSPDMEGIQKILAASCRVKPTEYGDGVMAVTEGDGLLLIDGAEEIYQLAIKKLPIRAVAEPPTSAVLKGPREGFTEDVKTNMVLLRMRIHSPKFAMKTMKVGRYSSTTVVVAYLDGVVNEKLPKIIMEKISKIDIDGIIDSSYISKFLEDRPYSIFKQVGSAEKPDIIAAKILEGRVAIIVDGSPIVITLPFNLLEDFRDSQDYYKRPVRVTMLRLMRFLAVFFALMLPAVFVSLQQHQFQMLPLKMLITIMNSVEGIPFSPILEMIIALLLFEILGEASVRMPRYVGMAMSIVGAIILGDTAVKAGILSSLTVLITAISGISLYTIPDEVGSFSVLRMLFVLLGGAMGIFGIVIGGICVVGYLTTLELYGVPYLAPFAPLSVPDLKDSVVKYAMTDVKYRPEILEPRNKRRMK